MKKYLWTFFFLFCFWITPVQAVELEISSKNALLYNLDEQKVLYEKNADESIAIASLTKIMTSVIAVENIKSLDEKVILLHQDFEGLEEANASVAGFKYGQIVTYRDLLYGLLLPSGADAAQALTRTIAGGRKNFVSLMNEKASLLGMTHTHFVNETGLDEEGQYSTLEDVAILFHYALKNPILKEILQSDTYTISDGSIQMTSTIAKNIKRYHLNLDYILGGKTGTTYDAGLCLASIASKNGTNYMLITARAPYPANSPYHFLDAKIIYDYFIEHFQNQVVIGVGDEILSLKTKYAKEKEIKFYAKENIQKYLSNDFEKKNMKFLYKGEDFISYQTKIGTKLGTVEVIYEDNIITTIDIILNQNLHFSILEYIKVYPLILIGILLLLMFFICFIYYQKFRLKKRKNI